MMRVAIVDDDPIVCSSLSTILKATGTADIAWTAYDGETAVGQYEEDNPDEEEQKEKNSNELDMLDNFVFMEGAIENEQEDA